ncbi:hypothetical protein MKEN_01226400 [Mycena kentingensis (nom. inval.)]|nr:hypothetical protein MKEN_01226400 [Mycena kentingensis (nom. inval.)]
MNSELQLFYCWREAAVLRLESYHAYKQRKGPFYQLFVHGRRLVSIYQEVLELLCDPNATRPEDIRIQNSVAAAVFDVDAATFLGMNDTEREKLRRRGANTLLTRATAPAIVVYLGPRRGDSRPAVSAIEVDTAEQVGETQVEGSEDEVGALWHKDWDVWAKGFVAEPDEPEPDTSLGLPCPWGWVYRTMDAKSQLVFLSGAYVVLQDRDDWDRCNLLDAHTKVTIYHQLVHVLRNKIHDGVILEKPTEKIIDPSSKITRKRSDGEATTKAEEEAGRYAQSLAFGGVVDLLCDLRSPNRDVVIYTTNASEPIGTADYALSKKFFGRLFCSVELPFTFEKLANTKGTAITIPGYARTKPSAATDELLLDDEEMIRALARRPPHVPERAAPGERLKRDIHVVYLNAAAVNGSYQSDAENTARKDWPHIVQESMVEVGWKRESFGDDRVQLLNSTKMAIGDFIASFFTVHNEAEEKPEDTPAEEEAAAAAEEPEEEEPEDAHPAIRAECETSPSCAPLKHHFDKCQEKVQNGDGEKAEDCVEEMCTSSSAPRVVFPVRLVRPSSRHTLTTSRTRSMMHCSEACAAPKLFAKLK